MCRRLEAAPVGPRTTKPRLRGARTKLIASRGCLIVLPNVPLRPEGAEHERHDISRRTRNTRHVFRSSSCPPCLAPLASLDTGSLVVSLFFGAAQVVAGVALCRRLARDRRWEDRAAVGGALAGVWLVTSGAGELLVAAIALAGGGVSPARSAVDTILFAVTALVIFAFLAYLLLARQRAAPPIPRSPRHQDLFLSAKGRRDNGKKQRHV